MVHVVDGLDLNIAKPLGQVEHRRVGLKDLGHEAPHASIHGELFEALLKRCAQARTLPFRDDHVGNLSKIGRWIEEIGARANDLLVLTRADDGDEGHVLLEVHVAEALGFLIGKRADAPKEAHMNILRRHAVKHDLHALYVASLTGSVAS
jgi:hypothetical protein